MIRLPCQTLQTLHKLIMTIVSLISIAGCYIYILVINSYSNCSQEMSNDSYLVQQCQKLTKGLVLYLTIGTILHFMTPFLSMMVIHDNFCLEQYRHVTLRIIFFGYLILLCFNVSIGFFLASSVSTSKQFQGQLSSLLSPLTGIKIYDDLINSFGQDIKTKTTQELLIFLADLPILVISFLYWVSELYNYALIQERIQIMKELEVRKNSEVFPNTNMSDAIKQQNQQ